jgi:two-component system, LytTR family, response regulator
MAELNGPEKVIIVDDEVGGRNTLKRLLELNCPTVKSIVTCSSVDEAIAVVEGDKPDLVFLDIEMPGKNGFELLSHFTELDFYVIFVTAFDHYAIQAIKLNALDYLLKPVRAEDLVSAVGRVQAMTQKKSNLLLSSFKKNYREKIEKLAIPIREGFSFVDVKDIIRCEADANYSVIFLDSGPKIVSSKTLGEYEDILGDLGFMRIHKSHLINLQYVKRYVKGEGGTITMKDGVEIPVSRRKREDFLDRINLPK